MAIRVYKFGLLPPTANGDLVREVIRNGHHLYNDLVAIERGRRAYLRSDGLDAALQREKTAKAAASEVVDRLEKERGKIKAAKAYAKKQGRKPTDEQKALWDGAIARIDAELKSARLVKREAETAHNAAAAAIAATPEYKRMRDIATEMTNKLISGANLLHGSSGQWITKGFVKDRWKRACKTTPMFSKGEPNDPRFRRWDGTGTLMVSAEDKRWRWAMPVSAAFGASSYIQFGEVDARAWDEEKLEDNTPRTPRGVRRRLMRTYVRLRVDSSGPGGREPVWAEWPMIMHRPFPAGAKIKFATVSLRKIGPSEEWSISVTCDVPDAIETDREGVAAVDIGWRRIGEDTLRVATVADSAGGSMTLDLGVRYAKSKASHEENDVDGTKIRVRHYDIIAKSIEGALAKADAIRGQRDKDMAVAIDELAMFLDSHTELPAWMRDARTTIRSWKSQARLAALHRRWRGNRFDGDSASYEALRSWAHRDRHLWLYEAGMRDQALGHRREEYRIWAKNLVSAYGTIVLEDFNLSEVAQSPQPEEGWDNQHARGQRQKAAVSELRQAIVNAATREGVTLVWIDPAKSTHTCHACGHEESFDAASAITHSCSSCGSTWDQDENAAKVLLNWYMGGSAKIVKTSRRTGNGNGSGENGLTPRQRATAGAKARKERLETARKPCQNAAE